MVDIAGLEKAAVLWALHGATRPLGLGHLQDKGRISFERAQKYIDESRGYFYFDYLEGRPLKVNLSGDSFDERLYDRDAGPGAAARAIDSLRKMARPLK